MNTNDNNRIGMLRSGIAAWAGYDFINSLLIINGSLYFSAWITQDQGVNQFWYGFTYVISTLLLLAILPIKGAVLDRFRTGREILFVLSVILAVAAFCLPGIANRQDDSLRIVLALGVFGVINFAYQASLVSYNWTLVHLRGVNNIADVRRVSGLGEAAGSLGSVVGVGLGLLLLELAQTPGSSAVWHVAENSERISIFFPLSIIFLVLVVVDFWFLGQGCRTQTSGVTNDKSYRELLVESIALIKNTPSLRRFLLSFLFFADGLLTVQLYLPVYMRDQLHLPDSDVAKMFVLALLAGAAGASIFAKYGRNRDTRRTLLVSLWGWIPTLFAFAFIVNIYAFAILMVWCGLLYGVVWSSARAYLIELTPEHVLGRTFSFYAVFDRSASILGPLIWGGIMFLPIAHAPNRYIFAFVAMSLMVLVGIFLLLGTGKVQDANVNATHQ